MKYPIAARILLNVAKLADQRHFDGNETNNDLTVLLNLCYHVPIDLSLKDQIELIKSELSGLNEDVSELRRRYEPENKVTDATISEQSVFDPTRDLYNEHGITRQ